MLKGWNHLIRQIFYLSRAMLRRFKHGVMLTNCYYVSPSCHCVKVLHSRPSYRGCFRKSCVALGKNWQSKHARRWDQTRRGCGRRSLRTIFRYHRANLKADYLGRWTITQRRQIIKEKYKSDVIVKKLLIKNSDRPKFMLVYRKR